MVEEIPLGIILSNMGIGAFFGYLMWKMNTSMLEKIRETLENNNLILNKLVDLIEKSKICKKR